MSAESSTGTPADALDVRHGRIDVGGVTLHYVEAGQGPLVVLLHGFPEFWYSWRWQIPALAGAGFRVVAPDLRGYNESDKPIGVAAYAADRLAQDVAGLIRGLGAARAVVVGHDWGGAVAWTFAMRYPELLERLAILNVPHPERFMRALRTPRQLRKSWYIFFFQLPRLPEAMARRRNFAQFRATFRHDPVRPGAFSADDIERYIAALAHPGALTAAINYYRALFRQSPRRMLSGFRPITAPVLVIWGMQDRYLGAELAEPDARWAPHARVERLPDASHWVQVDRPERVNALLLDFLRDLPRPGSA